MSLALSLGKRGQGNVWPNPSVGCVLVNGERIVGRGWTQPGGRPNAIQSIRDAKVLEKSTLYVTLEPCSHFGKTPPY